MKEFYYTFRDHGSLWANFCSPWKIIKLGQIWIGLTERASKNSAAKTTSFLGER